MSTATVSSPKKSQSRSVSAKWDDDKTRTLLEVFDEEITKGNMPGGIYSKQAWMNILVNFNVKTGLGYNKDQLRNRQDNLRREFSKWEALIGKETGLGWDNEKRTLDAPDSWWAEKSKVEPSILKYKDAGPVHQDLLQRVFGGVTANGFHAYVPSFGNPLMDESQHLEQLGTPDGMGNSMTPQELNFENVEEIQETEPTQSNRGSVSKLPARKRLRDDSGKRVNQSDEFTTTVSSLNDTLHDNLMVLRRRGEEEAMTYSAAMDLLKGLPGFTYDDEIYWKGVRVLEDKIRRIAFVKILDGGVKAVTRWLATFPDP